MEEQKTQINTYEYKDREGNFIGTSDNLHISYQNVMLQLGIGIGSFNGPNRVYKKVINDRIKIWKAIRYCYDGDTSQMDNNLNSIMEQVPDFERFMNYKPIKLITQ